LTNFCTILGLFISKTAMTNPMSFLKPFAIIFVIANLFLVFAAQGGTAEIGKKAENEIKIKKEILSDFIQKIENKVQALAKSEFTHNYLAENSESNRKSLAQLFFFAASANDSFMQIRFLDDQGWEKVRVDRPKGQSSPTIIKEKDLQNKGNRDYFSAIAKTPAGQLWHSRFDLNIERGEIEKPLNPTFRVGTPVYIGPVFKGIVIINLRLEPVLDLLRHSADFVVFLVDQDGKYIIHPDRNEEWGRYFTEKGQILEPISEDGYQVLNQKSFKNGVFAFSLSQNLQNDETIRLILAPKKETLDHFQSIDQQKSGRQTFVKEIELTRAEVDFLKEHPVIQVHNEMNWPPFNFSENGVPKGFSIDYMKLLAAKVGIKVNFISGPTWDEFLDMTKKGKLDIMLNIARSPEREQFLAFAPSYMTMNQMLYTRKDFPQVSSMKDLYGKRFASPKGFYLQEVLQDYPQISIVEVAGTAAAIRAVSTGKADALFDLMPVVNYLSSQHQITNLKVGGELGIEQGKPIPLHLAVRKDIKILADILKKGMTTISDDELRALRKKWLVSTANDPLMSRAAEVPGVVLSSEEKTFLMGRKIRLGIDIARPPFEYIDEKSRYSGISAGFITAVAERLGIEVVPLKDMKWTDAMQKVKSGEVDVIPKVTPSAARSKFIIFTKPYLTFPSVIVTRKGRLVGGLDDLLGLKVGVNKGQIVEAYLNRDYPKLALDPYPDIETGLRALASGRCDAYIDNLGTVAYTIETVGLANLRIAGSTPFTHDLAFGVRKDWPLLASALDKALASLTEEERSEIKNRWLSLKYETGIPWRIIVPIGASLLVIIGFVLVWNRRLGRVIQEREGLYRDLHSVEQTLNIALKASNTGIWKYDLTPSGSKNVYMSDQWYKQIGYARGDFAEGQDVFAMVIHPEDRDSAFKAIEDHEKGLTKTYETEFRLKAKDGSWRWILSKGQAAERDADGRPTQLTGTHLDITERKEAEAELQNLQQTLNIALEASNTGIWKMDPITGDALYYGDQWFKQLGYRRDDFSPGQDVFSILLHPDDSEIVNQALDDHKSSRTDMFQAEFRLRAKDGSWKWIQSKGQIIEWDDKQVPTLITGAHLDITERKASEEELKSKIEELERFGRLTIDREERMIELKEEINQLCIKMGNPPKYKIVS